MVGDFTSLDTNSICTFNNIHHTFYNCSGNDVWERDINVRRNYWVLPEDAHEWLSVELTSSEFPLRTGNHFEHRTGMVNYSIVGRNANQKQRKQYVEWDTTYDERDVIANNFNRLCPDLEARPGGETGIDIAPRGYDKSQILQDFDDTDRIIFFGDRMDKDGNDYPLAQANKKGVNYPVTGWKQTWEILNENFANRP